LEGGYILSGYRIQDTGYRIVFQQGIMLTRKLQSIKSNFDVSDNFDVFGERGG
jgi:hypothetical protein